MKCVDAAGIRQPDLTREVQLFPGDLRIEHCLKQRFIAAGRDSGRVEIHGTPGNAPGAYLDGDEIEVMGNAQYALGDTMNAGRIIVHGSVGDTPCAAAIFVEGNAGCRTGVYMKAHEDRFPAIVIGGRAGTFLGEYQAGGLILVLGLHTDGKPIVSSFPCTGMHGDKLILRSDCKGILFPRQVSVHPANEEDILAAMPYLSRTPRCFGGI